jgi:hypothetical protein
MARGKSCPECGTNMWAKREVDHPAGTEVLYECNSRSCGFQETVFEDKR